MDGQDQTAAEIADEASARIVEMAVGRELERIARALERDLDVPPEEADDAVLEAVTRTLERDEPLDRSSVGAFVVRTARNCLIDLHRSRRHFDAAAPKLYEEHDHGRLEDLVVGEQVFREVRALVEVWENAHWRAVTLAFLDAVYAGEDLTYTELAERASAALGHDLSPDSVRVWKSRGIKRLKAELIDQDLR